MRSAAGATVQVAYARWLGERVLKGIDPDSETVHNMLCWLAQAGLALAERASAQWWVPARVRFHHECPSGSVSQKGRLPWPRKPGEDLPA
jgi:hypothetical protein